MIDSEPNSTNSENGCASDKTPEGDLSKRKRDIDPKTGALREWEEYPEKNWFIHKDQLAGKKRIHIKDLIGNNYEVYDNISGFERRVNLGEDENSGEFEIHFSQVTNKIPNIGIAYLDTGRWRGIWIDIESLSGSANELTSLPEEERFKALFNRSPKENLKDFLSFYNIQGRKAFYPSIIEDEQEDEIIAGVEKEVDIWSRLEFAKKYQHLTEAEKAFLATEVMSNLSKIGRYFLGESLDEKRYKEFIELLGKSMLIIPEMPENILSLPLRERMANYAFVFNAAIVRILDMKYEQIAQTGEYTVTILPIEEDDTSVTIYTDYRYKDTYKLGDKMRKEEYEYTVTEAEDGITLTINNLLKPQTIKIKFPPNGSNIEQIRETIKGDNWINYSSLIPTEVTV